jgi:transposase
MYKALPSINESVESLKVRMKREAHPLKQQRLQALYLVASGQVRQRQEIAAVLGVSRNAVGRWLEQYEQDGLEAVMAVKPRPGKAPTLSPAQMRALRAALARPQGFGSYVEVQHWIASELGVEMAYPAVHRMVRYRLGAKLKVARPSHVKKTRLPAATSRTP